MLKAPAAVAFARIVSFGGVRELASPSTYTIRIIVGVADVGRRELPDFIFEYQVWLG